MSEIKQTLQWFQQAIPEPTVKHACVQIGCAYEETAELSFTLGDSGTAGELESLADDYKSLEHGHLKEIEYMNDNTKVNMLDDIVDEIVTRVGVAHTMGFDLLGALAEVNRSNFSKFEDGKPVFDNHGKITKGKNYIKPNLEPYISNGALENKMNIDKLETQSEEQPKRVKVEWVKIDKHTSVFSLADDYHNGLLLDSNKYPIKSEIHLMEVLTSDLLYKRIETEITERDEFIQEAMKHGANKGALELGELRLVEKMFDSGKYKLVEGE